MKRVIVLAFATCIAALAQGDIYKCIDATGHASYQATSCPAGSREDAIDDRYSSVLPLGITKTEAQSISAAEARRAKARETRANQLRKVLDALQKKQQRCENLKSSYLDLRTHDRLHASGNGKHETDLIRRMREACSED